MRFHRHRTAVSVLALCLGALTACDGSDVGGGRTAEPPAPGTAGGTPPQEDGTPRKENGGAARTDALRGKVIVIDPGHNGGNGRHPEIANEPVFVGNGRKPCDTTGTSTDAGYTEHTFNWDVANRLARLLREEGAEVRLTRDDDTGAGPCITERAAVGNRAEADAAVSIHADGAPPDGHGFHIIQPLPVPGYNDGIVPDSRRLGRALRDAYRDGTGMPYSNYRARQGIDNRDDLGGLNLSRVPKVFIECGNMRNRGDAAKLSSATFRQRIARSLENGLAAYFAP
jgi:N-acetylmuramoyl-L-alanine amidase